jgi:hypothetical protein
MTDPSVVYAADEDLALRASADFAILCPKDQCLAYGTDGSFGSDRWALQSSSVDFNVNGVAPGQVVRLTQPVTSFKPPGEALVVDSVGAGLVWLRRKGMPSGAGQPPAPSGGLAAVEFTVTTLGPQVARASDDLNRRFGINDRVPGRRPADLFDLRELREATVLTVLYRQYLELSRGSRDQADVFVAKALAYKQELDDLLARLVLHWSAEPGVTGTPQVTTRLSARLSR